MHCCDDQGCNRYESTISAIHTGTNIGVQENWDLLKNHSNCEDLGFDNVQFMQFIPRDLSLKLSIYKNGNHAFQNAPVEIDLKELFIR